MENTVLQRAPGASLHWTCAVTLPGLSLACLACAIALVLLSLCCCGGHAGHRGTHEAAARVLNILYSKELSVHLSISLMAPLFLCTALLPALDLPLSPPLMLLTPLPTVPSLCSLLCSLLFSVPLSFQGDEGLSLLSFCERLAPQQGIIKAALQGP